MDELPLSRHEEGRIAALRSYDILDMLPEQDFDNITQLTARVCNTPIALISFIDDNVQWIKSRIGLDMEELSRDQSFCRYTILDDELFEVTNPLGDTRFAKNPLVTGVKRISYYAGVPLINKEGYRLGTLSIMSPNPHKLNEVQRSAFRTLAQSVMTLLELRRATKGNEAGGIAITQQPDADEIDFTTRVLLSEQLAQAEALSKTGSWELNIHTHDTTWSNGLYTLLEISEEDRYTVDRTLLNFVAPTDKEKVKAAFDRISGAGGTEEQDDFRKVTKKGKDRVDTIKVDRAVTKPSRQTNTEILEFRVVTRRGTEKTVKAIIRKRLDKEQQLVGLYGTLQEILPAKINGAQPLEINLKNTDQFRGAPFGYHVTDTKGYFTEINETELSWLGYTRDEVVGRMAIKGILAEESARAYADSQLLFEKNGSLKDIHLTLKSKDGTEIVVAANFTAVYNEGGSLASTKAILFDITKLKKANEALEESEAMYRNLIEESAQMLFTADTQGRFTFVSSRLKKTIGYSNRDLLGKLFASIYDGEWRKKAIAFYNKQLLDKIEETTFLFPIIIRTGERLWIEQVATLITKNNNIIGYRFALYDITERLKTQEAMQEAARLATEAKDMQQTFLGKMSHEIRTPMNGVVGMVNLLNTTQLTPEQQEFVDGIKESSVNMIRIINDILDVTKIQSGKLIFEETDFALKNLVNGVIFALKAGADKKGIQLISQIDSQVPDLLVADPVRLNQVLLNLADNALKFTEKGSISIQVRIKENRPDGMNLEFIVADTGIGIPENKVQAIFESFTQAESDTTRKYGGTGLGLTIAKQLIEQQGGEIKVISREGKGTTFTFTFNFKLAKSAEFLENAKPKEVVLHSLEGYHILLVEDNVMNQRVAKYTIEKWGAKMSIADRGAKAVDMVAQNNYDLILMDIQMPEMNGVQTASKIRKELKCNTPIMAMTASVMQGERENCVKVGMNDYISKPFNPAELNQKIWDLLPKKEHIVEKKITNINYLRNAVGGDLSAIKEILEIYLSKTPPLLDALENEMAVNKTDNIESIVHNLKNSVGIIGADALFHLLDTIEANLHKKEITPDTISMIKRMIVMARQSMREIIDEYKLFSI
ncbi:hypothetical protein CJD36_018000 [Flavipsychrobacter stenotrophus]|uniref:histidine kinase n=1 Tax=Flavipsychrobacter stenotrophus TaxID=2077091 RepID=A0A2S7ST92_9BACT|nr:PAS domain S-box protein [Flavipsychrobacter stenotrophus]PQJ09817.1 hypothetical protein CJD36_018000 [Flavipsychrobacter stenotrophus]